MSVTLKGRSPYSPNPGPTNDPWIALLVAADLAVVAGLLDGWSAAVTIFGAVLALFAAYREAGH
ncbi:hypothetical protein ACTD5D_41315 [Nocardia takedensis]|uniref:hypothetical protein n=1 Tax=Nocardia takedensis TaxID=259390 RepID=UPI003F776911